MTVGENGYDPELRPADRSASDLLKENTFNQVYTGSVSTYYPARRPILCIPGDGDELDDLLRRTRAGTVLDSAEEGARYLENGFAQWEQSGTVDYECDEEEVARYSRVNLTRRLAGILDSVCTANHFPQKIEP